MKADSDRKVEIQKMRDRRSALDYARKRISESLHEEGNVMRLYLQAELSFGREF